MTAVFHLVHYIGLSCIYEIHWNRLALKVTLKSQLLTTAQFYRPHVTFCYMVCNKRVSISYAIQRSLTSCPWHRAYESFTVIENGTIP